ncbi:META domain-containing protein [Chitinophaga barathri]|uniref:META domain-containing protein n=1 Tax=Chitinophaga barathri TaxID=1647451 RepID=A0A3N4M8V5_9BACT|nr:META domain-containing protein [Chitinophaga barathri]RPD37986.1 META domain-containing protein [Chitinophaga barathri]
MKQMILSALALGAILTYACQGTSKQATQDTAASVAVQPAGAETAWKLEGTRWKLKELPGGPQAIPDSGKAIFMQLVDTSSQVQGFLGCNGFGAKYLTTPAGDLQITNVISTQMACPALDVENAFSKALEGTSRYTIEKDLLRLQKGDSILATFTAIQE